MMMTAAITTADAWLTTVVEPLFVVGVSEHCVEAVAAQLADSGFSGAGEPRS